MLSEKEINAKMDSLAAEYMQKKIPYANVEEFENLAVAFTYKQTANLVKLSENLVKQSKTLTGLTMGLIVLGLGMLSLAITQLVVLVR